MTPTYTITFHANAFTGTPGSGVDTIGNLWVHLRRDGQSIVAQLSVYYDGTPERDLYAAASDAQKIARTLASTVRAFGDEVEVEPASWSRLTGMLSDAYRAELRAQEVAAEEEFERRHAADEASLAADAVYLNDWRY